jgi:hypothetical protein
MSTVQLERRLKALEEEVARLKATLRTNGTAAQRGWKHILGSFAGDPLHEEAMRLGRRYREAQRPGNRRRR